MTLQAYEKGRRGGFTPPSDIESNRDMAGYTRRYGAPTGFFMSPIEVPGSNTLWEL